MTHDQKEALAIADRIAVMQGGRILQVDAPRVVYRAPASREVAAFLGDTNLVEGRVTAVSGTAIEVESVLGMLRSSPRETTFRPQLGQNVWVSIRPECWRLDAAASGDNSIAGRLEATSYLGEIAEHKLATSTVALKIFELNPPLVRAGAGELLYATVSPADVVLLPRAPS